MTKNIPLAVLERLEREWRMIDADRPRPQKNSDDARQELTRLKVGRADP
jgi:hypothetical protein